MKMKFNVSGFVSGVLQTHGSSAAMNNQEQRGLLECNGVLYPSFNGVVLDLSGFKDAAKIPDIISFANAFQAAEIRARDFSFAKKLISSSASPKVIKQITLSLPYSEGSSTSKGFMQMDATSLSRLKNYYNQNASQQTGELDPISLNGLKSLIVNQGDELLLVTDEAEPSFVCLRDKNGYVSVLEIGASGHSYEFLFNCVSSLVNRNGEVSVFITDTQVGFETMMRDKGAVISEEIIYGVSREQYCDLEHELIKLPRVFRETKNGPVFGVDY